MDQDGHEEFLFCARYDFHPSLFLVDMDTKTFWSYTPTGAAGDTEYCIVEGEDGNALACVLQVLMKQEKNL